MNGIVRFARATPTRTTRHDPRARINQFPPPPARCHCSHARRNAPNIASMRYPRKISGRRLLSTACTPKEQTPTPPPPPRPAGARRARTDHRVCLAFISFISYLGISQPGKSDVPRLYRRSQVPDAAASAIFYAAAFLRNARAFTYALNRALARCTRLRFFSLSDVYVTAARIKRSKAPPRSPRASPPVPSSPFLSF